MKTRTILIEAIDLHNDALRQYEVKIGPPRSCYLSAWSAGQERWLTPTELNEVLVSSPTSLMKHPDGSLVQGVYWKSDRSDEEPSPKVDFTAVLTSACTGSSIGSYVGHFRDMEAVREFFRTYLRRKITLELECEG